MVGEQMTIMRRGQRESAVCDLCLERPRAVALGEPERRERVRTAAGAANVRSASPAPPRPVPDGPAPAELTGVR
jgi:hypothetical protein